MRARLSLEVFLPLLALLFTALPVPAQFGAGIQGTIKDPTGAVIPGATVTATNIDTAVAHTAKTSGSGFYRISELAPGNYAMKVEVRGFKTSTSRIEVTEEAIVGFNAQVEPGGATENVDVSGAASAINTESGSVTGAISAEQIERLPATGRDPYELLRLAPGVFGDGARNGAGQSLNLPNSVGPGGSNSSIYQTENLVQISANGQRASANNFKIDGVDVNSLTWGGAAIITPSEESIKEMTVTTSTYTAEDGRNSGAQIKVVSQSGTNTFHGSAFFNYQSPGLNAYNGFSNVGGDTIGALTCNGGGPDQFKIIGTRCPDRANNNFRNFGGRIGGPIIRNRAFFFFSTEELRSNTVTSVTNDIETSQFRDAIAAQRAGTVTAAVLAAPGSLPRVQSILPPNCASFLNAGRPCQIVGNGMDIGSVSSSYGQYVGTQGGGLDGVPDLQIAQLSIPSTTRGQQYNGKVDFNQGSNQFAVSTYITRLKTFSAQAAEQGRPMADLTLQPLSPSIFISWIRTISPTLLNEARFNFSRFAFDQVASNTNVNFGIPLVEVEALPGTDRLRFGAPRSESTPGVFAQNTFTFRDVLSKQLPRMALKVGFEFGAEQNNNNLLGGARPDYSFTGIFNLANGTPVFEAINADPRTGQPAAAQRYFRTKDYGLFFQDDWKVRPNLTVNLGLRYEYFSPLSDDSGQLTNLILGPGAQGLSGATLKTTNQLTNPDRNNFAPRLGFAWSPNLLRGKTVLRGGVGVSYDRVPSVLFENTRGNPPFFARFNECCGFASSPFDNGAITFVLGSSRSVNSYPANPVLSQGIDPATGIPVNGQVEIWGAPKNFPSPYIYNYSLETETQLPGNFIFGLGYQGSTSRKLVRIINENFIFDATNPHFTAVFFPTPDVNASYNSLNVRVAHTFSRGFQLETKYRWSRSIDDLSNEGPGFVTNQTFPRNQAFERGPSDYDATHYFVLSGLWDLPILRGRHDLLGNVLGGWKINGILTAHSGFPWTPVTNTQALQFPGGQTLSPVRPIAYLGGATSNSATSTFLQHNGNFPGGGKAFFDISKAGTPGIGRNSFRGPRYSDTDMSFLKDFAFPYAHLGEQARVELRATFFNVFNKLNLAPFGFDSSSTVVEDTHFGQATSALSGRVVEFQARFSF
ncbi:MAG TPA: TonB-dependent receptor [Verrucomicrobiae bacterium]|nr:TonB-dependent receptor [Verrucomicrobiae bacterium]